MKNVWYVGELPPPFGGVTVKNDLVYNNIFKELEVKFLDLMEIKRKRIIAPLLLVKLLVCILVSHKIIVGVGGVKKRKRLLKLIKVVGGFKSLKKVIIIGMGGQMHITDTEDDEMLIMLKNVDSIWLESNKMIEYMENKGLKNVFFFPNCRTILNSRKPVMRNDGKLKLVYFSKICKEKGVDIILNAYSSFPSNVSLDFYGEIAEDFKSTFEKFLQDNSDVRYNGVFDAVNNDVYEELNKYDMELLPTRWKGEGVPGALIEAKMSGISAIVSDWNYNSEVIVDKTEGIVLRNNTSEELVQCISSLAKNALEIERLKKGAFDSRKRYCIETYKKELQERVL